MEVSNLIEANQTILPATECALSKPCPVAALIENTVASVAARHGFQAGSDDDVALLDQGFTSMGMVDLMLALEAVFEVEIPQKDLTSANFSTKTSIAALVHRLLEGKKVESFF